MTASKTILVIGGAGYIGSHTVLALEGEGLNVVIYDNFSSGHSDFCEGRTIVEGELTDRALLVQTMQDHSVDAVIHFAALIEAGVSIHEPLSFFANNVAATVVLLEAMDIAGVRRIVFSSTAAVYGHVATSDALTENLPMSPINPYGDSKAMVEKILTAQANAKGLNAIALRYFNASGADPEGRSGERHDPETHLIPLVLQVAAGTRDAITVFGSDYDTPDGTCIRDYIHVADLAAGHVAALKSLTGTVGGAFKAMNLGCGIGHSVREVIETARKVTGKDIAVIESDRRAGDPAFLIADPSAAMETLGWKAECSDLETIIADAWRYAKGRNC